MPLCHEIYADFKKMQHLTPRRKLDPDIPDNHSYVVNFNESRQQSWKRSVAASTCHPIFRFHFSVSPEARHDKVIKDGFTVDDTDIMQSTKTESLTGIIQLSFSASLNSEQTCKMLYITPKNQLLHVILLQNQFLNL